MGERHSKVKSNHPAGEVALEPTNLLLDIMYIIGTRKQTNPLQPVGR
jgi:hypothetical protein